MEILQFIQIKFNYVCVNNKSVKIKQRPKQKYDFNLMIEFNILVQCTFIRKLSFMKNYHKMAISYYSKHNFGSFV